MRRARWLLLVILVLFVGCGALSSPSDVIGEGTETLEQQTIVPVRGETPDNDKTDPKLTLTIGGTPVEVQWEDNAAVIELRTLAQNASIVVNTSRYGGFEQVGSLPQALSREDTTTTTQPGDIVLYAGNQLVVFFGTNSWSYTKLGQIKSLSADELTALLGGEAAIIEIGLEDRG